MLAHDSAASRFSHDSLPVCLRNENPIRLVSLWDMYQIYMHNCLTLFDELRDLEIQVGQSLPRAATHEEGEAISNRFKQHLADIAMMCDVLRLSSSQKQIRHIATFIVDKVVSGAALSPMLLELRRRIREDLEDHVYFCVPDKVVDKCFTRDARQLY